MSLINQMLKDLEKRKAESGNPQELPKTIQTVNEPPSSGLPWSAITMVALLVTASAGGAWWLFVRSPTPEASGAPVAEVKHADPSAITPVTPPVSAPEPAVATVVESSAPPSPEPANPAVPLTAAVVKPAEPVPISQKPVSAGRVDQAKPKRSHRARRPTYLWPESDASARAGDAEDHYSRALRLQEAGRESEARDELEAAVQQNPEHAEARRLLAKSYAAAGQYHRADELLNQHGRTDSESSRLRAQIYLKEGKTEQAEQVLIGGLEADDDPDRLAVKGALRQQQGRYGEAAEYYSRAIKAQPAQSKWWLGLAISLEGSQRYQEALGAYQRVLDAGAPNREVQRYVESRLAALRGGH